MPKRIEALQAKPEPRRRYIIAITPRSGSSYLCDTMAKGKRLGMPGEMLNQEFIPSILKSIPGRTPDEYLRHVLRAKATKNGVAGLKASWFQFRNFTQSMSDLEYLAGFKYIYLTRRDLAAQAVSLYKATSSSVFHTNIQHQDKALEKLDTLEYDFKLIKKWYEHIVSQEQGWKAYFYENRIFPLCIAYEDIEEDVLGVMKRIAMFVKVNPDMVQLPEMESVFKKVSDQRNVEWAHRFRQDLSAWELAGNK